MNVKSLVSQLTLAIIALAMLATVSWTIRLEGSYRSICPHQCRDACFAHTVNFTSCKQAIFSREKHSRAPAWVIELSYSSLWGV